MEFPFHRGFRELLKPHGMYSIRRFVAIVMTGLTSVYIGVYILRPSIYDPDVIAVLSGAAGVSAASAAVKKYDKTDPYQE